MDGNEHTGAAGDGAKRGEERQAGEMAYVLGAVLLAMSCALIMVWRFAENRGDIARDLAETANIVTIENRTLRSELNTVKAQNEDLISDAAGLEQAVGDIEGRVKTLAAALEEKDSALRQRDERIAKLLEELDQKAEPLPAPREVVGQADLPVERAMANDGESVEGFADRVGTTPWVLRALNDWLGDTQTLTAGQALWVPKDCG